MARVPSVDVMLEARDTKGIREAIRNARESGIPLRDIAESVVAEADARFLAGDLEGCNSVIFNAVHTGVPIYELFAEIKRL